MTMTKSGFTFLCALPNGEWQLCEVSEGILVSCPTHKSRLIRHNGGVEIVEVKNALEYIESTPEESEE